MNMLPEPGNKDETIIRVLTVIVVVVWTVAIAQFWRYV